MLATSALERPRSGIRFPGLMAWGFAIQRCSSTGVFGIAAEASEKRLARWVRSGPTVPCAAVPRIWWQLAHWRLMKSRSPVLAAEDLGAVALAAVSVSQR